MEFEWDDRKNHANLIEHGISFERARSIFSKFCVQSEDDRKDYGEKRELRIGPIEGAAIIVVVYTVRDSRIRLISARPANKKERRRYYETLQRRVDD